MLTLVEFLRARLAEDEAACRAARKDGGGGWNLLVFERGDGAIYDDTGNPVLTYDTDPETGLPTRHDLNPLGARQAAHIVRHDPDRVLAEIESKRQIVRAYDNAVTALANTEVGTAVHELMSGSVNSLRHVLQLLLMPYTAHPDFKAEWLP